ncbi:hypothetical protein SESBI_30601 [Sesbania bispinosa]|nr:hypothetical protein SESBI_30601 [Sesbania bispinosa]
MPLKSENFVPQMNAKSLRVFSRAVKRKNEVTTSATTTIPVNITTDTVIVDGDNEVSSTTLSDQLIAKRSRTNLRRRGYRPPKLPLAPNWFHVPVLVHRRGLPWFPNGGSGFRDSRIGKVGLINTTKMIQTFSAQSAFLGHALEIGVGMLEKEIKDKHQKMKDLANELARERKANEDLHKVRDDLKSLQDKFESLSLEIKKIKTDFYSLKKAKDDADLVEIAFQYEQGFDKAVEQVKFLYLDLKLEVLGAYKVIEDGKLVEPPEDDE